MVLTESLCSFLGKQIGYIKVISSDWNYVQFSIGTNTFALEGSIEQYDGIDSLAYLQTYQIVRGDEHPTFRRVHVPSLIIYCDLHDQVTFKKEQSSGEKIKAGSNKGTTRNIDRNEFGKVYCSAVENWLRTQKTK